MRMYRKQDRDQLYLEDFNTQFGGKLRKDNRWVQLSEMMPWHVIEDLYAENFSKDSGINAINARIAFGAIFIKEHEGLDDRKTVEYIMENPYAQYFLGIKEFREEPLFDASVMVHFRKRFPSDFINKINRLMFEPDEQREKENEENDYESNKKVGDKANDKANDDDQTPPPPPTDSDDTIEEQGQVNAGRDRIPGGRPVSERPVPAERSTGEHGTNDRGIMAVRRPPGP
jgi:hypothetical protein